MKKKNGKTKQELTWINGAYAVDGVNNYSDDVTFFNLHVKSEIGDITIYGCRVVSGSKGDFISFPSRKGDDGKYYNHIFVSFDDEVQNMIIDSVSELI